MRVNPVNARLDAQSPKRTVAIAENSEFQIFSFLKLELLKILEPGVVNVGGKALL